ncbi:MAG: D-2-hydroxyacid dehydrogenase [Oscillospiraceae bacterium]|nr:D-2-hydroxyacid dehydrogenase [Oscillospiraceae bacterium]
MKIVLPDWDTVSARDVGFDVFSRYGEVICCGPTLPEEAAEKIGDAEIVLCNKTPITRDVIAKCPNLRYIGLFATGFNNIDLAAASERGIVVSNAGEYSTQAVVQHTFALLLSLAGSLHAYERSVREGAWEMSPTFSWFLHPVHEISGKTMAIIGYGSIGRGVARVAEAFGMKVIVSTRSTPKDCPYPVVSREEAFRQADVLSVHCPLNEQTAHMVCQETLALMKPSAFLINTARGGIVKEQDLADALNEGRLAGAGLDVLDKEPMSPDTPLKTAKNCIITPHIAWSPLETRERLVQIVAENLECFLAGTPKNQVN